MLNIILNTRFSAIHCWPECPIIEVGYLRNPHRHEFHVKMKMQVHHANRDVEFIQLKNDVNKWIRENWEASDLGSMSCEDMCKTLFLEFGVDYVSVLEDGENGAEYIGD